MMIGLRTLMLLSLCAVSLRGLALDPDQNPVGSLHIVEPSGTMRGLVILYSGANGWDQRAQHAAIALGRAGALVAGIDLREYERHNRERSRKCFYLVGDAEAVARELQRARKDTNYHAPMVAGIGIGGALSELVLREAPPSTLAGAVSIASA